MEPNELLRTCSGFQWDGGNAPKIWDTHNVSIGEAEQVFFNHPLVVGVDVKHSTAENRYYALGESDGGRRLFIVFTIRKEEIRIISARDMSRRERKRFESS